MNSSLLCHPLSQAAKNTEGCNQKRGKKKERKKILITWDDWLSSRHTSCSVRDGPQGSGKFSMQLRHTAATYNVISQVAKKMYFIYIIHPRGGRNTSLHPPEKLLCGLVRPVWRWTSSLSRPSCPDVQDRPRCLDPSKKLILLSFKLSKKTLTYFSPNSSSCIGAIWPRSCDAKRCSS